MVNSHSINERASLLSHQLYAERIHAERGHIENARRLIANEIAATGGTMGEQMWLRLLSKPWDRIRAEMLADTPKGRLLRSNSPFSLIIGVSDTERRRQLWRQAKHDLSVAMI